MNRAAAVSLSAAALMAFGAAWFFWRLDHAAVEHLSPYPQETFARQSAEGWPTYGGPPGGAQYSSLDQISRENVSTLDVAWVFNTGDVLTGTDGFDKTSYQVTPIFADGKLLLCTPRNNIIALDPESGAQRWRFDFGKAKTGGMYGQQKCRGVAYWETDVSEESRAPCAKRVLMGTDNGFLVAVDAVSGAACDDFGENGRVDLNALDYNGNGKISITSAPAIYENVVIVGGQIIDNKYENAADGIVRGFDVRTGEEVWNWNPIPADLRDKIGSANAWAPISIDRDAGLVFLPTGSPSHDVIGVDRLAPVEHGNAVVALNALTGEKRWSFQTIRHDLWDYDLPSMPTLVTLHPNGEPVDAVIQATKTGFIFVFDRETGEPIFEIEERPVPATTISGEVTSPTQPVPTKPQSITSQSISADDAWGPFGLGAAECREMLSQYRNEGLFTPPEIRGSIQHPTILGGSNWGGVAYDQESGIAVVNSSNLVASVVLMPREDFDTMDGARPKGESYGELRGTPYVVARRMLFSSFGAPCNPPPWGALTAIDMNRGEIVWRRPFGRMKLAPFVTSPAAWGAPNQGGPIITAGGLIFIGASLDSRFRAFDLETGKELWSAPTPAPAVATPMSYESGGRQYVLIAAGGHGGFGTPYADAIIAYALPE